jgi:hypothetical protein
MRKNDLTGPLPLAKMGPFRRLRADDVEAIDMSSKAVLGGILLAFALATVVTVVVTERRAAPPAAAPEARPATVASAAPAGAATDAPARHEIRVTYFHGTKRCNTCRDLEAFAREALEVGFPDALMAGTLAWQTVNTEDAGNEHFVTDYELAAKSLVVADVVGGRQVRYKKLDRMWDLVGDKPAYQAYVQAEVRAYLDGAP